MKSELIVLSSSGVSKNNTVFTVGSLASALEQSWREGVPTCISHNIHRPIGWTQAVAVHIEPKLSRIFGATHFPDEKSEVDTIKTLLDKYIQKKRLKIPASHVQKLKQLLSNHISTEYVEISLNCAAFCEKDLAKNVFSKLFSECDSDGLVPLSKLKPIGPGVFQIGELAVFAHQFFRRSLSRLNCLNTHFLSEIQNFCDSGVDIKLRLDSDCVGLAESYVHSMELEYWWGPKFNSNLCDIETGVTHHNASKMQVYYHGITGTDFWWHKQDDRMTLECEEISDIPAYGVDFDKFACRYVHSMLEIDTNIPVHIDGAVRLYTDCAMTERLSTDISRAGRNTDYTKLWRIDGETDVSSWKSLITHYFRDNGLVREYFIDGETDVYQNPKVDAHVDTSADISRFIPCNIIKGDGVRITISHHETNSNFDDGCYIVPTQSLIVDTTISNIVDYDSIEIVKLIKRHGVNVEIPNDSKLVAFDDMVLNLPIFLHSGKDALNLTEITQKSLVQLLRSWSASQDNRIICANFGVRYSDRDTYFSFMGHVDDLLVWFQNPVSRLPNDTAQIYSWCDNAYDFVRKAFPSASFFSNLENSVNSTGLQYIRRVFLDDNSYSIGANSGSSQPVLAIHKDYLATFNDALTHQLNVAFAFSISSSTCSKCNQEYVSCPCCRYVDGDITEVINKTAFQGLFWTNRKA